MLQAQGSAAAVKFGAPPHNRSKHVSSSNARFASQEISQERSDGSDRGVDGSDGGSANQ